MNILVEISILINNDAAIFKIVHLIVVQNYKKLIVIEIVKFKKAWYLFIAPFLQYVILLKKLKF